MNPPVEPETYALWLTPFVVLAAAGGIAAFIILRARNRPAPDDGDTAA